MRAAPILHLFWSQLYENFVTISLDIAKLYCEKRPVRALILSLGPSKSSIWPCGCPCPCVTQIIGEKVGLIIIGLVKETTLMASTLCNKEYQRKRILRALVLHLKQQA
jgi:hypothetical protein